MRALVIQILLLFSFVGFCQNYSFTRLSKKDGLPSNSVSCFLKDREGFMWVGTSKGLCKYDGTTFRNYTKKAGFGISDDDINALFQDSDGLIWIGTNTGGVNVYDPIADSLFVFMKEKGNPNSVPGNRVRVIKEDKKGSIWIGFDNNIGLSKLDKKTNRITNYDPFGFVNIGVRAIRSIVIDEHRSDTIWLATTSGLIAFDTKSERFQLVNHTPDNVVWSAHQLSKNEIVCGFFGSGTDTYNIKENTWRGISNEAESPVRVFDLVPKSDQQLWLAARKKGLAVLDIASNTIERFPSSMENHTSPFPGFTYTVYKDEESLWVGGVNGISFYDSKQLVFPFESLHFLEKEYGRVTGASGKYDKIYLSGIFGEGLWEIDKRNGTRRVIDLYTSQRNVIYNILETDNQIILNDLEQNVIVINRSTEEQYAIDLNQKIEGRVSIRNMKVWTEKKVILVTWFNGVHVLDLKSQKVTPLFDFGLDPPNYHDALVTSDGTIWCTNDEDIAIYDPKEQLVTRYIPTSIPAEKIKGILSITASPDGTKWIGTLNGLIKLSEGKETLINTLNSDLASNFISDIEIASNGTIWLETDEGISKLDPSSLRVTNYGAAEGMRPAGAFELIDDQLLVGQNGGYSLFATNAILQPFTQPEVHFTDFSVANAVFKLEKHIDHTHHIDLDYHENFITFEFTAPAFSKSQEVYYSYQLEGLDQDWVDAGKGQVAKYTNLDGGAYLFKVRARNKDGEWTSPKTISLFIASPFWETWWFYSLCVAFTLSIGLIIYKVRVKAIQRKADLEAQELQVEALQKRLFDLNLNPFEKQLNIQRLNDVLKDPLTDREFEVLELSLQEKTNGEIAEQLFVSKSTVKFHLRNTYKKLGVSNRREALIFVNRTS